VIDLSAVSSDKLDQADETIDIFDAVVRERDELRAEVERLKAALRQILEDPDAQILDSHRDDGWAALV
jgi:hypothetical protein